MRTKGGAIGQPAMTRRAVCRLWSSSTGLGLESPKLGYLLCQRVLQINDVLAQGFEFWGAQSLRFVQSHGLHADSRDHLCDLVVEAL